MVVQEACTRFFGVHACVIFLVQMIMCQKRKNYHGRQQQTHGKGKLIFMKQAGHGQGGHTEGLCMVGAKKASSGGMFARRTTFLLTIPTSTPDLPSHGEAPQVDHVALPTFPTKHVA